MFDYAIDPRADNDCGVPPVPEVMPQVAPLLQRVEETLRHMAELQADVRAIREQATLNVITAWSHGKQHYPAVQDLMGRIMAGGIVPPRDGHPDLDTAYELATRMHPDTRELVAEEEARARQEAEERASVVAAMERSALSDEVRRSAFRRAWGEEEPDGRPGTEVQTLGPDAARRGAARDVGNHPRVCEQHHGSDRRPEHGGGRADDERQQPGHGPEEC